MSSHEEGAKTAEASISEVSTVAANHDPKNVPELTNYIQSMLQQMQDRFQTMSDQIISRIDDMGTRIDELEHNIQGIMVQTGGANSHESGSGANMMNSDK
eukprot:snap_masked-scaffold375_size191602-processed-gene-0.16 protein:Tk05043 transcript:snap_masked-scaffold375_size191602-processed-gene-0.16-mRNA-1 annotation:"heat shock factor-binding protein 1"